MSLYKKIFKGVLDYFISLVLFLILCPFLLFVALIIKIESNGSALFSQKRLGKNGKEFRIYKFRTLYSKTEELGSGLFTDKEDPRITKVGKILRRYSIDELPQLINILKGEMSFIGPRPPVPYHPFTYNEYPIKYKVRFLYKPGISGWAQVNGRTNLTWVKRLEYDIEYHKKFSFFFDIIIFSLTIRKILKGDNVYPIDKNIGKSHLKND